MDESKISNDPKTTNMSNTSVAVGPCNRSIGYNNTEVSSHTISPYIKDKKPTKVAKQLQQQEVPKYEKFERAFKESYKQND